MKNIFSLFSLILVFGISSLEAQVISGKFSRIKQIRQAINHTDYRLKLYNCGVLYDQINRLEREGNSTLCTMINTTDRVDSMRRSAVYFFNLVEGMCSDSPYSEIKLREEIINDYKSQNEYKRIDVGHCDPNLIKLYNESFDKVMQCRANTHTIKVFETQRFELEQHSWYCDL